LNGFGVLLLDRCLGGVIVFDAYLVGKCVVQIGLCPARGLLRRPTGASTPGTDFPLAVAQYGDADLALSSRLHDSSSEMALDIRCL
jgi:hypothetical protein